VAQVIYLDLYTELKERLFTIIVKGPYDPTGIRDKQFLKRGLSPIYQTLDDMAETFRLPMKDIINLIFQEISFQLDSDEDLIIMVDLLNRYLNELAAIDLGKLNKHSDEIIFIGKCRDAYGILSEMASERKLLKAKANPDAPKSIFDILRGV